MNALTFPNATLCEVSPRPLSGQNGAGIPALSVENLKPRKSIIAREAMAGCIAGGGYVVQRKHDGEFCPVSVAHLGGRAVFLAEFMRRPISGHFYTAADRARFAAHPGGWWMAFRLASLNGHNWLQEANSDAARLAAAMFSGGPMADDHGRPVFWEAPISSGAEFAAVMVAGAEGVCAHPAGAAWGEMLAFEANGIYLCRVTGRADGQSVRIADAATGQDRGKVALRGGKCDQVRAGSIIRVEAMGETDAGKLRQPVACSDWLVQF